MMYFRILHISPTGLRPMRTRTVDDPPIGVILHSVNVIPDRVPRIGNLRLKPFRKGGEVERDVVQNLATESEVWPLKSDFRFLKVVEHRLGCSLYRRNTDLGFMRTFVDFVIISTKNCKSCYSGRNLVFVRQSDSLSKGRWGEVPCTAGTLNPY